MTGHRVIAEYYFDHSCSAIPCPCSGSWFRSWSSSASWYPPWSSSWSS